MGYRQKWCTYRDGVDTDMAVHTEMGYIQIWGTYRDGVHTEMVYIQRWV